MDQFYFEEGYLVAGYLTVVKEASAGLTPYFVDGYLPLDYFGLEGNAINGEYSLSALLTKTGEPVFAIGTFASIISTSVSVNVIASGQSAITSAFTQTSTISHIEGADLTAFSNAQLEAAVRRIRDNNITASAAFSVAVDFVRTRNTASEEAAEFSLTAINARSRDYASLQSAAFSLAVAIDNRTRDQSSALASEFVFTVTISHIEGADLVAFSNAALTATATRIKQIASTQSANTTVVADVRRNPGIILNLSSQFTQTALVNRTARITQTISAVTTVVYRDRPLDIKRLSSDAGRRLIDTSIKKFGSGSLSITSGTGTTFTGANLGYVDHHATPSMASSFSGPYNDRLVEFWFYSGGITQNFVPIVGLYSSTSGSYPNYVWYVTVKTGATGQIAILGGVTFQVFDINITVNTWHHIAIATQGWANGDNKGNAIWLDGNRVAFNTANINGQAGFSNYFLRVGPDGEYGTSFKIDELRIITGPEGTNNASGFAPTQTSITVPTDRRWNADSAYTRALFHYDIDYRDDIGIQQVADALTISSAATVTAAVDRIRFIEFAAAISSEASISAVGIRVRFGSASLASAFTQSADVARTRSLTSNQDAVFTQSTEAVKTANIVSALDSQATFTGTISHIEGADLVAFSNVSLAAIGQVTRQLASTQSSEFASTADNLRVRFASIDINSAFTQSVDAVKTATGSSTLSTEAATSTQGQRVRFGVSALNAESTLSATAEKVKVASALLASEFSTSRPYILGDYLETGYYEVLEISAVKTASAVINTEALASELAAVVKIAQFFVNANVVSTLTAELTANKKLSADLSSSVSLTAVNDTLRGFGVILQVNASQSSIIGSIKQFNSAQASQFTVAAAAIKTGTNTVIVSSEFALSTTAIKLNGFDSALSSESAVEVIATRLVSFSSNQNSQFTQSSTANTSFVASAGLSSAFSVSATISHIEGADIVANGFATLTANVLAGKFAESDQSAEFTQTTSALRLRGIDSSISSSFTVIAAVNEVVQLSSTVSSESTLAAAANKTVSASSSQTAVASVSCVISHIEGANLVANNFATLLAIGDKIARITLAATSAVNLTASADKFRAFNANLAVSTTVVANVVKVNRGQATLQAQVTIVANATRIKQFSITISSAMTFVAAVREIDAASLTQFVYTIAREDYVYIVPDEVPVYNDILYVIPNENWLYNITAETRVFPVDQETRIYNIRST